MSPTTNQVTPVDSNALRKAFAAFPSGVVAVAAMADGKPVGMAASSFTSVSIEPPLVSICAAKTSTTWPKMRGLARLGLSVLSAEQGSHCRALASKLSENRFVDIGWQESSDGAVFVDGASLWLECSIHSEIEAGDHEIILLQIDSMTTYSEVEPLVFHGSRFRQLVVENAL